MNDFINIYLNNNTLQLVKSHQSDALENILATIETFKNTSFQTVIHKVENPQLTLETLYTIFPKIIACGGIVRNEKNEILFIFRRNKWDLPKGKLDKGESLTACAIREVQEETGIQNVILNDFVCNCYHIYYDKWKDKYVLKETFWYSMTSSHKEILIPQTIEDIERIEWMNQNNMAIVRNNTFESIKEVIVKIGW